MDRCFSVSPHRSTPLALLVVLAGCAAGGGPQGAERLATLIPQEAGRPQPIQELFTEPRPLVFTLEADFEQLARDREEENEERPARLLLPTADGDTLSLPLRVRTRGNFRLRKQTCSFPPLRLNFPEDSVAGTVLQGQDKLKLVTHCWDTDRYEQNVVEELLVYRMYNALTDVGFRAQLAFITYRDTSGRNPPISRMGFLLEDGDRMAERLGGALLDLTQAPADVFHPQQAGLVYLFQYMIGNADWSIRGFHNMEVVRIGLDYYPIPYDFDFSGFVDAPYAGPSPHLAHLHSSVRQRLFRGFCSDQIDYVVLIALFHERRESILELIRTQPGLSEGNRRSAVRYVEEFFHEIRDPDWARRRFEGACRR